MPMADHAFTAIHQLDDPLSQTPVINPTTSPQIVTPSLPLAQLAEAVDCFHAPDGEPYATVPVQEHWATWPLRSRGFRDWLAYGYFRREGTLPSAEVLQKALRVLEGKALFEGPEEAVFVRLAERDDAIYLDLANAAWEAVEVTAQGWQLVTRPPVKFLRRRGMRPLPCPAAGGALDDLRRLVNVRGDADWQILIGWLLAAFRPRGPYPVLHLHGDQGATKSTLARLLRALIDPNQAPLRAEPRSVHDLMIAAANAWVLAFDNLSQLPPWLSDAFCRLATGGGFGTRALYTNQEEVLFDAQRPVLLTGIEEMATRGDLLDRALLVELPDLSAEKRRSEDEFWHAFEAVRPCILGALLDAVSAALRQLPTVQVQTLPRMADFATWVTAAAPALGWADQDFLGAYAQNREAAHAVAVEDSAVAQAVHSLAGAVPHWEGTATDLLAALTAQGVQGRQSLQGLPTNARALSAGLRRLAPNLRALGVTMTFARGGDKLHTRRITIRSEASGPA
jgi:hypothetical protein